MDFKTPMTTLLILIAGLSTMACVQELPGHVESLSSEFQLKNTDGELVNIPTGPMTMSVESKGFFFASKVTIKTGDHVVKFKVPKTAFTGDKSLEVDAETIEQPVGLKVSVDTKFLGSSERQSTESCTYSGFCFRNECDTEYSSVTGRSELKCSYSYGHSFSCSGSREIEIRTNSYDDTYTAHFSKDAVEVGTYTSKPIYRSESYKVRDLSDCR